MKKKEKGKHLMRKTKSSYESYTCSFTVIDKKINVREADFILSDRVLWLLFPPHMIAIPTHKEDGGKRREQEDGDISTQGLPLRPLHSSQDQPLWTWEPFQQWLRIWRYSANVIV